MKKKLKKSIKLKMWQVIAGGVFLSYVGICVVVTVIYGLDGKTPSRMKQTAQNVGEQFEEQFEEQFSEKPPKAQDVTPTNPDNTIEFIGGMTDGQYENTTNESNLSYCQLISIDSATTFTVLYDNSETKISLIGVDANQTYNEYYTECLSFVERFVTVGEPYYIQFDASLEDGTGNIPVYLFKQNTIDSSNAPFTDNCLNAAMLLNGYASYKAEDINNMYDKYLKEYYEYAADHGKGLFIYEEFYFINGLSVPSDVKIIYKDIKTKERYMN